MRWPVGEYSHRVVTTPSRSAVAHRNYAVNAGTPPCGSGCLDCSSHRGEGRGCSTVSQRLVPAWAISSLGGAKAKSHPVDKSTRGIAVPGTPIKETNVDGSLTQMASVLSQSRRTSLSILFSADLAGAASGAALIPISHRSLVPGAAHHDVIAPKRCKQARSRAAALGDTTYKFRVRKTIVQETTLLDQNPDIHESRNPIFPLPPSGSRSLPLTQCPLADPAIPTGPASRRRSAISQKTCRTDGLG